MKDNNNRVTRSIWENSFNFLQFDIPIELGLVDALVFHQTPAEVRWNEVIDIFDTNFTTIIIIVRYSVLVEWKLKMEDWELEAVVVVFSALQMEV